LPACPTKSAGQDGTKQVGAMGLQIADCGLRIGQNTGDAKLTNSQSGSERWISRCTIHAETSEALHSAIRNPQSAIGERGPASEFGNPGIDDLADQIHGNLGDRINDAAQALQPQPFLQFVAGMISIGLDCNFIPNPPIYDTCNATSCSW
jgi:hypothetical protein